VHKRILAVPFIAAAAVLFSAAQAPAAVSPSAAVPSSGVSVHNANLCGTNMWTYMTVVPRLKAHDSAGTCISAEEYHADFQVTKITKQIGWQYPNLSDGFELSESGCPSSADMKAGLCSDLPVKWADNDDGTPAVSGADYLAPGVQNDSFDIWLAPSESDTSSTADGDDTELMIWLAHPGINDNSALIYHVDIGGTDWGVMSWEAHNDTTGESWRYVAFLAPRTASGELTYHDLWLNEFFRSASAHGWLPSSYWLIAVDKGFEINSGGLHDNVHAYSITGLK
jgi:hypothetical protein